MSQPTPDFQIKFLEYIQRILDGGTFSATYKFALLMALADLSVEKGGDDNAPLPLTARDVARKFIVYYSRQARPFRSQVNNEAGTLHQNAGRQAAVVSKVLEASPNYQVAGELSTVRAMQKDSDLLDSVTRTVVDQPLWKLQTIGNTVDAFLYKFHGKGGKFELNPGVAFCFRKFHGFVYRLAQDSWIRFVRNRAQNQNLLGESSDLAQFMFGSNRSTLLPYRELLMDLQHGRCFYCGTAGRTGHVDHFIPWSWYSLDLGHNFVLACNSCNSKKRDMLAGAQYLKSWLERNQENDELMTGFFEDKGLPHDLEGSIFVARWAYGRVAQFGGTVWVQGKDPESLSATGGWTFPQI